MPVKTDEWRRQLLRQIDKLLRNPDDDHQRGFLEGRAYEITTGMDEHPEWWQHGCNCDTCRSYGEPDIE